MQCSSCNAEIGTITAFCPFCGREQLTGALKGGTTPVQARARAIPVHSDETRTPSLEDAGTLRIAPDSWGIPRRYASQLASGTKPEAIISELVRHNLKMRIVLEGIMQMLPSDRPNRVAETIKGYLQSHCVGCGTQTRVFAVGSMPVCADCDEA